ncbi:hypothetical protein C5167_027085 [Papaver somniferum]|nr:hypothetical protein C5167_027085 [Papaver somniferum]
MYKSSFHGDDVSLQKVLNLVHKNSHDYVAVLFYASWCPFSRTCRPTFAAMSSILPSSTLHLKNLSSNQVLRYGVHGFPTLFLFNSTMRVRYHGSHGLSSLVAFYSDVTGKARSVLLVLYLICSLVDLQSNFLIGKMKNPTN